MTDIVDRLIKEKCDYDTRCYAASEIAILRLEKQRLRAALEALLPEAISDRYVTQSLAVKNARAALGGEK